MQPILNYLAANIPAILLMLCGVILLIVEMYIPGFGAPGIIGLTLTIAGIILGSDSIAQAIVILLIILVLLGVALFVCMRSASKGRLSKSKLILHETATDPDREDDLKFFEGHIGTAHTALRPAGIVMLEDVKLNAVSDGEFISAGESVKVIRVEGKKIVVTKN